MGFATALIQTEFTLLERKKYYHEESMEESTLMSKEPLLEINKRKNYNTCILQIKFLTQIQKYIK
jgi:hypothetical protein